MFVQPWQLLFKSAQAQGKNTTGYRKTKALHIFFPQQRKRLHLEQRIKYLYQTSNLQMLTKVLLHISQLYCRCPVRGSIHFQKFVLSMVHIHTCPTFIRRLQLKSSSWLHWSSEMLLSSDDINPQFVQEVFVLLYITFVHEICNHNALQ